MHPGIWTEFNNYLSIVVSHYTEHTLMCATLPWAFKDCFQALQSQTFSGVGETYAACTNAP